MKKLVLLLLGLFVLFPYGKSETNEVLRIAVYDSAPFGFVYPDSTFGGLMVEVWESIADELEWQYEYTLTDMESLLTGLENGTFDAGIGAISITPKRERRVDFSQPVNPSGTGIASSAGSRTNAFKTYWKPILASLLELIASLLFVLLLSGTAVWIVERDYNHTPGEKNISNIADGLWWSAVTMTTVGYGDKVPNSTIGKVLGIVWIFTSIILLSLFTANASAIISSARTASSIQTLEDLRRFQVGAAQRSSGEEFVLREHLNYTAYPSIEAAIEAMLDGQIDCVVSNVPVLQYLNNSTYYQQLAISPRLLLKNNMGIALPDNSPLKENIDLTLLQKITEPKWQKAVYKYLGEE